MKQFLFFASAMVSVAQLCSGSACVSGTLSSYIALGTGGCSIGTNTLSGFHTLSGTSFATPIDSAMIAITPLAGNPGFTAAFSATANTGTLAEALFTYQIAGASYSSSSINLTGSIATNDGTVTDVQNFCAGGTFGPDGLSNCSGLPGTLIVVGAGGDQASFPPVPFLNVTDDFTLDGGTAGSASGGSITDRFTAVPEPLTLLLTAMGLAFALALKASKRIL
jgi:hypothetical protein